MTKIYKKLHLKLRKPLILRASEYLSMREKEKTVSLVLLPTQPQLNPKVIVAVSLILPTLCRYNINSHMWTTIEIYARCLYLVYIFKKYFTKKSFNLGGERTLTQDDLRKMYRERTIREKQTYIAKVTRINGSLLSQFAHDKIDLCPACFKRLQNYLTQWFLTYRSDCMILCELNQHDYTYLIQLLNEKYYQTTDIHELKQINSIYKQLKFKSESWLNKIK